MRLLYSFFCLLLIFSCTDKKKSEKITQSITKQEKIETKPTINKTSIVILGTIQDAGSPQIGCKKECCAGLFKNPDINRQITSLGLIDTENDKSYLFEATPDIVTQIKSLIWYKKDTSKEVADGIFLTHAHIGHYTGLMFLGKEAMDANKTPVFTMPKMKTFLTNNGPWSQLVKRENIVLNEIQAKKSIQLSDNIEVIPLLVPHRDEYSETVGYKIKGPNKTALFIPDIDKWEKWEQNIIEEIKNVDYAFLDATFYSGKEINNRDISQIPHPFIIESLEKFKALTTEEKSKIIFIHFNHTNPVIRVNSKESQFVNSQGFNIARINNVYEL